MRGYKSFSSVMNNAGKVTHTLSSEGYLQSINATVRGIGSTLSYEYDNLTGNVLSREGMYSENENFIYDDLDRLITVTQNGKEVLNVKYADNGNIIDKTGVGKYEYGQKPHAVVSVENVNGTIPSATLTTEFNDFGKVRNIQDGNTLCKVDFVYGPDMQRWKTIMTKNGNLVRTVVYGDDYEKVVEGDKTTEFYYVDDNVILVRFNKTTIRPYFVEKDNLGSVLKIYGIDASKVFDATYDVWGKQSVTRNTIGFLRGYCGHEMLNDFDIINMNGRLYDPVLGRFFSPDNYVQMPDNSQNFNRYTYCLNNPLKFTDPSGEFLNLIVGAAIGGVFNWILHEGQFNAKGLGYFFVGSVAGAVSAGISSGVNVAMAGGNFWTGAAGLANGISSTGFLTGAASGACAGFAGSFLSAAGNSWIEGNGFGNGLWNGFKSGGVGTLFGGISGGISGGLDALDKGTNFWTGNVKLDLDGAYSCSECMSADFKVGEKTITGKYVGQFEGQNVFESSKLGNIDNDFRGFTVPERGIIVAEGVFTSGKKNGMAMMQHEFGHILQYRKIGSYAYWHVIAPESLTSATFSSYVEHGKFWTETWANYLSKGYFGRDWMGGKYGYPVKQISSFNMIRLLVVRNFGLMNTYPHGCF